MASRIHQILPNAYKLMCFDRNIYGNRDVKSLECDYLLVQQCVKLNLEILSPLWHAFEFLKNKCNHAYRIYIAGKLCTFYWISFTGFYIHCYSRHIPLLVLSAYNGVTRFF